jgi:ferredoxin
MTQKENKTMNKTAWVDQDMCISCGLCIGNIPDVFQFADNGKAEVYDPTGAPEDTIQREAIDICPVSCIHWQD